MFVIDTITHRLKRGCATMAYPKGPAPALPDRHGGALKVEAVLRSSDCRLPGRAKGLASVVANQDGAINMWSDPGERKPSQELLRQARSGARVNDFSNRSAVAPSA